mmetsp:Transcript_7687/g.14556  ORF Transcript_7687/g.14556 Transcript_7687/m.14556 type:complete len:159 (-) Transcript_7687:74-550(-)
MAPAARLAQISRHLLADPVAAVGAGGEVSEVDELQAVREVMDRYTEATWTANVEMLKTIFHENAIMNGYIGKIMVVGSPQPFYDEMADLAAKGKSFKAQGFDYKSEVTSLNVYGNAATATVVERGYGGKLAFTDVFHLLKVGDAWKIMSKLFTGSKMK